MCPADFVLKNVLCSLQFFLSEGFSVGSQSSVAGYSQLPFPAASQTHLTSGIEGKWESLYQNNNIITINNITIKLLVTGHANEWTDQLMPHSHQGLNTF